MIELLNIYADHLWVCQHIPTLSFAAPEKLRNNILLQGIRTEMQLIDQYLLS